MDNTSYIDHRALAELGRRTAKRLDHAAYTSPRTLRTLLARSMRRLYVLSGQAVSPAAGSAMEWLRDNWYLVRREGLSASAAFRNCGRLSGSAGRPTVYLAAEALLRADSGTVTEEHITVFLDAFQSQRPLCRRELELFVPALKAAAIAALARGCESDMDGAYAGRLVTALRFLGSHDLSRCIDRLDLLERTLRRDPAGIYPHMTDLSRESYRRQAARLARKQNLPEHIFARRLLRRAAAAPASRRHVGFQLFPERSSSGSYIAVQLLLTFLLTSAAGLRFGSAAALALLLPFSGAVKALTDLILLRCLPPRFIPRMSIQDGVPPEGKTLCVVSALISDPTGGEQLCRQLEDAWLCSRDAGSNLLFCLLADLPESAEGTLPEAEAGLTAAAKAIDALRRRRGAQFFLLTRPRIRNNGKYMGWERKRGAILELARFLRGQESSVRCLAGEPRQLANIRCLLLLDSDTRLTPGSAAELIGAMLHPLNRPVIDAQHRIVTAGYGIIQPRITTELASARQTPFSRLFAGQGGTDPYSSLCGEVNMDLTGSSVFTGKGILDIDAFLTCAGDLPEGCILSHDALEGALLRCGWAGDIELTDAFPGTVIGFYRRAHRWIRGDWQNAPWVFSRRRTLHMEDRWRLFDNLRRSLVAPAVLLCLLCGFLGGSIPAALLALGCFVIDLLIAALHSILYRPETGERYHSTVIYGLPGALCQSAVMLILLPYAAWISLSAAAAALYRMFVSRRDLLEWSVSAWSGSVSLHVYVRSMLPASALGLGCLLLSGSVPGKTAGLIWLLSPAAAWILSRQSSGRKKSLSCRDRCWLLTRAREIWGYFDDFMNAENHYLPPDNWQERPPVGLARRTSPTNIGLALLSVLSAADLGIITPEQAAGRISAVLDTLEALPKWHGHLYNWYSTQTLEILQPPYVSTVDSGNLCACLTALRRGLLEYGFDDLAGRAGALAETMDFSLLLDREKMLLRIGINTAGSDDPGCYDLLAGEARLTAFLAVARGDVPKKLWTCMSRALAARGHRRGMVSWTGTMFEYLMPELLLPSYPASLLYETHHFCLYVQKKRTAGLPWGCSESAYHALDPSLSYRYKAHGCQALALCPGMDDELVISPYSSFLALAVDAPAAVQNLHALEKLGMLGRYGFWEALDCTPARMRGSTPEIVRCVMAHHLGMSMVAVSNVIQRGIWQKRFMREPACRAYSCLLQERIPIHAPVLRRTLTEKTLPRRPDRQNGQWQFTGPVPAEGPLRCGVLSNGTYSIMSTYFGSTTSRCGDILLYTSGSMEPQSSHGIDFFFSSDTGIQSLLPDSNTPGSCTFTQREISFRRTLSGMDCRIRTLVCADCSGELRTVTMAPGSSAVKGTLIAALRPVLAFENDYVNHPAFFGLGLECRRIRDGLLLHRLQRNTLDSCWLCIKCSRPFDCDLSENALSPRLRRSRQTEGWLVRPTLRLDVPLVISPGESLQIQLALGFGADAAQAETCAGRALHLTTSDAAALPELSAALLGLATEDISAAMALLPHILHPRIPNAARLADPQDRCGLWPYGISGDWPLVVYDAASPDRMAGAELLIRQCAYLQSLSVPLDLVILVNDGGDYHRRAQHRLQRLLAGYGLEHLLGRSCGVHILDSSQDVSPVRNSACLLFDADTDVSNNEVYNNLFMSTYLPQASAEHGPRFSFAENGDFEFYVNHSLPSVSWTNILTNGRFGYLAADCGNGFLWMDNAREQPISPWLNRPNAAEGPECLEVELGGKRYSLFASGFLPSHVRYAPGCACWETCQHELHLRLTAFVPMDTDARVMIIESTAPAELHWRLPLSLLPGSSDRPFVVTDYVNQIFSARNQRSDTRLVFRAVSSHGFSAVTCDLGSACASSYDGRTGAGLDPCFAARLSVSGRLVLVCGCGEADELCALAEPGAAMQALERTLHDWRARTGRLRLTSPYPALDRAVSPWLPYQAEACRIMGRTSIYQSGGAIGFRDQLQDVTALLILHPDICHRHILDACRHQYAEGDVQHWWHPHPGRDRGVRTHCSDDLLWLPWAVCEYVEKTGRRDILKDSAPFLLSAPLSEDSRDRYEAPKVSPEQYSVQEHCMRALELILKRGAGPHGLLRMLGGDWNDGMDAVRGESVWLTWFFSHTARRFADLTGLEKYRDAAEAYARAAEQAWDGDHWLRGYFSDGTPLGAGSSTACRLDSIAQSFACLCPVDPSRLHTALDSALGALRMDRLTALFTPPFTDEGPDPGYIQSYGPGFRENGGQYTHAAVWLAMACLRSGRRAEGLKLLLDLLPESHPADVYGAEPYVLSADVSTNPDHFGHAGWTWYTGSAGWYWRVVWEDLLGVQAEGGRLHIHPCSTPGLESYSFTWQSSAGESFRVEVRDSTITINGSEYDGKGLPL